MYFYLPIFRKIKKTYFFSFLVAPWINFIWYPKGWKKIDSFHKKPFDWNKIKRGAKYFEVFQSNNDPVRIPVDEGKKITKNLNAKLIIVKNAGHFNVASDKKFVKFPLLLENVKDFIKNNS